MSPNAAATMMRTVSTIFFVTALIFASGAFAGLDGVSLFMHDLLDFPLDGGTGGYTQEARWFSAIGGGVFAALCALLYLVIAPAIENGDKAIIRGATISVVIWFIIDSGGSIAAGVPANAVFNILFLAIFLAPLILVKSHTR
jgi:hypothetical protein